MSCITKVKTASREEWLALRGQYIGGSDAAAVVGLNSHVSPYSLWAEKTGRVPGFAGNLATEVGTWLEEFIAQKFAQETGKKVRKCNLSFLNSQYPFAIANIDREIVGEDAGLEIKSTDSINLKKFKGGEYPANYYVQCVHYMAVTGKNRWYLAVLIGNREFKWFTIERDQAEIDALMEAESDFMEYVKNNTAPPIDGSKATSDALAAVYFMGDGESCDLTMYASALSRYKEIKAKINELEKDAAECANIVKAFMGDSGAGQCDGFKVSWKPQTRRTFDAKRFEADNPTIDTSPYYNQTTSRVFRVTENK